MSPRSLSIHGLCLFSTLLLCGCIATQELAPSPSTAVETTQDSNSAAQSITLAWKTKAFPSSNQKPMVELFLVMSGVVDQEIPIGTFAGEALTAFDDTEDVLLERSWWSGTEEVVFAEQINPHSLVIQRRRLDADSPATSIMTIDIPAGAHVESLDEDPI